LNLFDANNAYYPNFYVQVPLAYISSLVLTYLNILYVCFFYYFLVFFFITEWQHWYVLILCIDSNLARPSQLKDSMKCIWTSKLLCPCNWNAEPCIWNI